MHLGDAADPAGDDGQPAGETCGRLVEPRLATVAAALRAVLREPPPSAPIAEYGAQFTWEKTAEEYNALLLAAAGG